MTITISFLVDAGYETGYGHIVRCLALADELQSRGCRCVFRGNDEAIGRAVRGSYEPAANADYHSDVWVIDLEGGTPPAVAQRYRGLCDKLVVLNGVGYPDGDPGRLLADLVFYQGRSQRPYHLDWMGFTGEWYEGPKWLILRREFREHRKAPGHHVPPRVVVACGGSDPKRITHKARAALFYGGFEMRAIIGPGNSFGNVGGIEILRDPPNMAAALAWADLAIVSYGMTAFECLALGLPVVALSISPDHAASALLVENDTHLALWSIGEVECVQPLDIFAAVRGVLTELDGFSNRARAYVDGRGAERVADKILEGLDEVG